MKPFQGTGKNQFRTRPEGQHSMGDASNEPFFDRSKPSGTQENQSYLELFSQGHDLLRWRSDDQMLGDRPDIQWKQRHNAIQQANSVVVHISYDRLVQFL